MMEECPSGRRSALGRRVYARSVPRVRIPPLPNFFMEHLAFHLAQNGIALTCFANEFSLSKIRLSHHDKEILPKIYDRSFKELAFDFFSYFGGKNVDFVKYMSLIPFEMFSDFQKKVYDFLVRNICFGNFITYGKLASLLFAKNYSRAVGIVLKINPFPVIIPCHRVVPANFSPENIGGFNQGLNIKRKLLEIENII